MIAAFKGIKLDNHLVGESWEISGLKGHESVVANGDDKGLTLRQLIRKYRSQLVGKRIYREHGNEFRCSSSLSMPAKTCRCRCTPTKTSPVAATTAAARPRCGISSTRSKVLRCWRE